MCLQGKHTHKSQIDIPHKDSMNPTAALLAAATLLFNKVGRLID